MKSNTNALKEFIETYRWFFLIFIFMFLVLSVLIDSLIINFLLIILLVLFGMGILFHRLSENRGKEKMSQEELLQKIHKRLGWIMFWIIVMGLLILNAVQEIIPYN